jgi:thiol-disulfide isomerase/thioredoxin
MRKILLLAFFLSTALTIAPAAAAPAGNYHGIAFSEYALALQDFDAGASSPGSKEFVKVNAKGIFPSWWILEPAMKAGWDVTFDESEIKDGALLIFGNLKNDNSILATANLSTDGFLLKWYANGQPQTQLFKSLAEAENQFDYRFVGAINAAKKQRTKTTIDVGEKVPPFAFDVLRKIKNDALVSPDKVTMINFWATWCSHCTAEAPAITAFLQKHSSEINFYDLKDGAPFAPQACRVFQVDYYPTTIFIDKNGIIQYRYVGEVTSSALENALHKAQTTLAQKRQ